MFKKRRFIALGKEIETLESSVMYKDRILSGEELSLTPSRDSSLDLSLKSKYISKGISVYAMKRYNRNIRSEKLKLYYDKFR